MKDMKTIEDIYKDMFEEHEAIQAARGCNQYKHQPDCKAAGGGGSNADEKKPSKKKAKMTNIKADASGGANLLILPNGDVLQVSDNDLVRFKNNTSFSAFHINKDGTYGGTPEKGLMLGATLDEALKRFPALSESAKKDVTGFFAENSKNGSLRFYRLQLGS